ncbi:MAG: hypothetical protein EBT07_15530 [Actinobacteria bacterium]|nr:hypothetical protein [Actinomycetota bacterium]
MQVVDYKFYVRYIEIVGRIYTVHLARKFIFRIQDLEENLFECFIELRRDSSSQRNRSVFL